MDNLGFFERFFFAWAAFFRVLFDGRYAAQAKRIARAPDSPALSPELPALSPVAGGQGAEPPPSARAERATERNVDAALELLSLLQEHGRFVDFLQEDVTSASDGDLGAAARVVHQGCRKVLGERAHVEPLRAEEEGSEVVVPAGFSAAEVKLTGAIRGEAPFRGILRHRGWIAKKITLPAPAPGYRAEVLAAAEVEL